MVREYSLPTIFLKRMIMSKERKIVEYTLDNKPYKTLENQFKRELVYCSVLSKLLAELKKM